MTKKLAILLVAAVVFCGGVAIRAAAPQDVPTFKTVWDGVYTAPQAERGKELAENHCIECHGDTLGGGKAPPLHGDRWMELWREGALDNIYDYIRASMPAERPKGDLTDDSYLDILAYILQSNDMPAGQQELTRGPLWTIMIQRKDGPKPIPSQAPVLTVGCVAQAADSSWTLTNATEPVRNKKLDETNPQELKAYGSRPAGSLTFRLPNASSFKIEAHKGERVLAKGVLGRQVAGDRINLTLLESVSTGCQ
jgi:S-disulfanyl-L-cysteine oxidoreductase SoxD